MLLAALARTLAEYGFERRGDGRLMVCCSGGADSVALAVAAVKLYGPLRVGLVHVRHGVREDDGEDAALVEALGRRLGTSVSVRALSGLPPREAALRRARYEALEVERREMGAPWAVLAHTLDDQAETVLWHLTRSGGLRGLAGIPPRRGHFLRPWLGIRRQALRAYLRRHGVSWREDPSNREPRFLRNRIRKELLPLLESRYRPRQAERLAELARAVRRSFAGDSRPVTARRSASLTAAPRAPAPAASGDRASGEDPAASLLIADGHATGFGWVAMRRRPHRGDPPPRRGDVVWFDADALSVPRLRPLVPGDRIVPFGFSGRRKVRDLLREHGWSVADRDKVVVVVDASDAVLWVPGVVRSDVAPVGKETRAVWEMRFFGDIGCGGGAPASV